MHNIYHTEAFVLGSRNTGESNRLFFLFTKDLGKIVCVARGIRELKSKLRYSLQDFSYVTTDLVRGKEIWRITNAHPVNGYQQLFHNKEHIYFIARITALLQRLLHGEEKNKMIFETLYQNMNFLESNKDLSREDLHNLEIMTNIKILNALGYGSESEKLRPLVHMPPSKDSLVYAHSVQKYALLAVNSALNESQL